MLDKGDVGYINILECGHRSSLLLFLFSNIKYNLVKMSARIVKICGLETNSSLIVPADGLYFSFCLARLLSPCSSMGPVSPLFIGRTLFRLLAHIPHHFRASFRASHPARLKTISVIKTAPISEDPSQETNYSLVAP
jgi:hypothetical protein